MLHQFLAICAEDPMAWRATREQFWENVEPPSSENEAVCLFPGCGVIFGSDAAAKSHSARVERMCCLRDRFPFQSPLHHTRSAFQRQLQSTLRGRGVPSSVTCCLSLGRHGGPSLASGVSAWWPCGLERPSISSRSPCGRRYLGCCLA